MAVLLPNITATTKVRPHPAPRDAHGRPVLGGPVVNRGPFPGGVKEQPGGTGVWSIRLDPRVWPVRAGDTVTDGTRSWVLTGDPMLHTLPGNDLADYVAATGVLDPPEVP